MTIIGRLELGKKAGDFITENWAPGKVAERFLRVVNDDFPEEWLFDPKDIRYLHGWGLDEESVKSLIRQSLEFAGKDGLNLSDKPELEQKFIEFANSEN